MYILHKEHEAGFSQFVYCDCCELSAVCTVR